jgi:hypothetical protein
MMKDVSNGKLVKIFAGHRVLLQEMLVRLSLSQNPAHFTAWGLIGDPTVLLACGSHAPTFPQRSYASLQAVGDIASSKSTVRICISLKVVFNLDFVIFVGIHPPMKGRFCVRHTHRERLSCRVSAAVN